MSWEDKNMKTELIQILSPQQAWHYRIVPKEAASDFVVFLTDSDESQDRLEELEMLTGKKVVFDAIEKGEFLKIISKYYRRDENERRQEVQVSGQSEDYIYKIISEAKSLKSSDIHLEVYKDKCRIRIRVDGMLVERAIIAKEDYPTLVNKIKIMANLDIAEKRLPQDGRIFFNYGHNQFDIRTSVLPTLHGEKIVMRILSNDATNIDINHLGFNPIELENYLEGIKRPNGLLLISGPTGSGKTTTLYATLKLLNEEKRNILTIEDPIEYTLDGINQVQLKESIGLSFGSALRTFLRQDPDVIMVGEIRDPDTASMAIRAALTGHLVLSTIHTNSAWGTVSRLVDMGVPAFLLANTLNTTVAQRLVRLLCPSCKEETEFYEKAYPKSFKPVKEITTQFIAKGCPECHYTGYKGRKAIYEVISVDYDLSKKIKNSIFDISEELKSGNVKTIAENAFELFESGQTTIEEIYPLLINY